MAKQLTRALIGASLSEPLLTVRVEVYITREMRTSRARLPKKFTFEPGDYV